MDVLKKQINKQIESSINKNIFHIDSNLCIGEELYNTCLILNNISSLSLELLIDCTAEKTIREFCRINQYYSFNAASTTELKYIYSELFSTIKKQSCAIQELSKNHFINLAGWLVKYNPFAKQIYNFAPQYLKPIPCSEYSADLQLDILNLDLEIIKSPVLDIGCGKNAFLVKHLERKAFDVYGIDRFYAKGDNFQKVDWLNYDYGTKKWGTIISNLGFSNHFGNHHLREDGNYIEYATVYKRIIHSLKIGGRFHYAPDLSFIEKYIDKSQFSIDTYELKKCDYKTTIITRMK